MTVKNQDLDCKVATSFQSKKIKCNHDIIVFWWVISWQSPYSLTIFITWMSTTRMLMLHWEIGTVNCAVYAYYVCTYKTSNKYFYYAFFKSSFFRSLFFIWYHLLQTRDQDLGVAEDCSWTIKDRSPGFFHKEKNYPPGELGAL